MVRKPFDEAAHQRALKAQAVAQRARERKQKAEEIKAARNTREQARDDVTRGQAPDAKTRALMDRLIEGDLS